MAKSFSSDVLKILGSATGSHNMHDVLHDFVIMSMCAVHNAVPCNKCDKLEEKYMTLAKKYKPKELETFAHALGALQKEYDKILEFGGFHDVLGEIYMESATSNDKSGQFFTPFSVSQVAAEANITEQSVSEWTDGDPNGVVTLLEPTCGSGGMILAAAQRLQQLNVNYSWQMLAYANDIDERCVAMTYLQCAFLGIPAIITHGNGLTLEYWAEYHTPAYMMGFLHFDRQIKLKREKKRETEEKLKPVLDRVFSERENNEWMENGENSGNDIAIHEQPAANPPAGIQDPAELQLSLF